MVGALAAGALGTAAAATGALDNLPIDLPSADEVWATITGREETALKPAPAPTPSLLPETSGPVEIEGPIDTPEELEEAFDRIDTRRGERIDRRRSKVDDRIDQTLERRRDQGLPVPTPERESLLRERLEQGRERRDAERQQRLEETRNDLRERIESGEELTPRELLEEERMGSMPPAMRDRVERLREMTPEERRERLRQFRERRQQRLSDALEEGAADEADETEVPPEAEPASIADTEASDLDGVVETSPER